MKTIKKIRQMQSTAARLRSDGAQIVFVPTMGALHDGHLSLVRKAKALGDIVVVSIYVNPSQFGPGEDLTKYPRSLDRDRKLLKALDVDYLFLPYDSDIYPPEYLTYVETTKLTETLEGKSRSTHFRGVTTIVTKLLNIVQPHIAVFGQKDAQQSIVVRKMVADLNIPVKIVVAPTVREKSGLAISSRNRYFDQEQIKRASCLYLGLKGGRELIRSGVTKSSKVISEIEKRISATKGVKIDYISINDVNTMEEVRMIEREVLLLAAVWLDGVRLIDNVKARPKK